MYLLCAAVWLNITCSDCRGCVKRAGLQKAKYYERPASTHSYFPAQHRAGGEFLADSDL
jgi:hypothetical protein